VGSRYSDLSREELIRLLEARDRRDATRFGLVWEANEIERDRALNNDFVALDLAPELSAGSAPWRNLIIEGDNFDALRYLRVAFAGRVKCIYIDPPYNTGNRDFVYNDRFVDREDLWRHSKWCEFMFQRLTLARELLREDGVIFVSIDDNELFPLGMLTKQVFGERNFVATVIWQKVFAPKNTARHFSDDHEYIVVFAQNADAWRPNLVPRTVGAEARYKNPDNDPRGPWTSGDLQARNFYSEGTYPITCPSGRVIPGPGAGSYWRVAKAKFVELDEEGRIWWGRDGNGMPRLKRFLSEVKQGLVPQTLWPFQEVGHTQDAKKELLDVLRFPDSASVFSTPKPLALLERILRIATDPGDLVLDFFAGSGTTAHAVHKLNAEDGGRRRCILVSNTEATLDEPAKNLCRDVCAERVRRVIRGYTSRDGEEVPGLGGDFAYLRCRRIPPGKLLELDHAQVWTALQLIHREVLTPYAEAPFLWAGDEEQGLLYVPRFRREDAAALRRQASQSGAVTLYSWQPETLRQHVPAPHVQHEPVPESLARRFGLRA
jgi:adenine-specific DNA-methyltransferase